MSDPAAPRASVSRSCAPCRCRWGCALARVGVLLLGALLLLVGCQGIPWTLRDADLFMKTPKLAATPGPEMAATPLVRKMRDGVELHGWRLAHPHADGSLLFLMGNGDLAAWRLASMRRLADLLEVDLYVFDHRGFGENAGRPGLERCSLDALELHDWVATQAPNRPVGVYGYSIGSAFGNRVAAERPVRFLVLQAPPASLGEVAEAWQANLPWAVRPLVRLRVDPPLLALEQPVSFVRRVHCPLLVIHGDADQVIPFAQGEKMFAAAGARDKAFLAVPGGRHEDFDWSHPQVAASLEALLRRVRADEVLHRR